MKRKWANWALFIVGLIILTFGARILLLSGVGVGGLDAIAIGLAERGNQRIGVLIIVLGVGIIILGSIIRKRFTIWPIGVSIIIGWFYDVWGFLLFDKLVMGWGDPWPGWTFLIGMIIAPCGAALYILSDLSVGPVDYLMLAIKERMGISMQLSRIIIEAVFVIGGILVKGPIGIGTICIMLFWGPILQIYYSYWNRMIGSWLKGKQ